ncbi:MAG: amino acid adenylation domain-containing protein [Actinomycetota bacterium]
MAYLLHELMQRSAGRDPSHEAVRCAGRTLNYGELNAASNAIAQALIAAGVERGDRVAVYMTKRVEAIAGIYGVLKAGAAYVPLDPKAPVSRVALVANDCAIAAMLTTPDLAAKVVPELETSPKLLVLVGDEEAAGHLGCDPTRYVDVVTDSRATDPEVPVLDIDLAYILYTSGSTGTPKGVMLTHRNALTFVEWCAETIGVTSDDRFANHAPIHFDLSVFDLYLAAFGGSTVVLIPEREAFFGAALADIIDQEQVTVWYSVPSALRLLTKAAKPGSLASLRTVVFAGEVYPTPALRQLRERIPHAELWNLYGPTETNVCTNYKVEQLPPDDQSIPIGRACSNTEVFAVAADGQAAGVGQEGELYVRGATVMKGYWGQPAKSAEVLVPDPLSYPPDLVFRTGDLVKLQPDGNFHFLGRRDHQVKSRGYRIELGEVESALSTHPGLDESVVVSVPHDEWGCVLVAWVTARDGVDVTERDVRRHVAGRLPGYMVPTSIRIVGQLPKTSTGKIDRPLLIESTKKLRLAGD